MTKGIKADVARTVESSMPEENHVRQLVFVSGAPVSALVFLTFYHRLRCLLGNSGRV